MEAPEHEDEADEGIVGAAMAGGLAVALFLACLTPVLVTLGLMAWLPTFTLRGLAPWQWALWIFAWLLPLLFGGSVGAVLAALSIIVSGSMHPAVVRTAKELGEALVELAMWSIVCPVLWQAVFAVVLSALLTKVLDGLMPRGWRDAPDEPARG